MDKIPLTPRGAQKLRDEMVHLMTKERPEIIVAIATARDYGDLKENSEYHAAREKQGFIEGRIKEIEAILSRAQVIDPSSLNGNRVKFGATVTIYYIEPENEVQYQLVGEPEANTSEGWISVTSPVARALIGKEAGDVTIIKSPKGDQEVEILDVKYI